MLGKDITTAQKGIMCADMVSAEVSGIHGAKAQVVRAWSCARNTVLGIYKQYKELLLGGGEVDMSRNKRKGRTCDMDAQWEDVKESLPPAKRSTYRKWAGASGKSLGTLWRWAQK